jgi:DNA-binding NarL/FixJ family response regulator
VKSDAAPRSIPTVILATSHEAEDVAASYTLQANSYLAKPAGFETFETVVKSINDFWLAKALLPGESRG